MGETQEELNSEVVQQLKELASLVNIVLKNTVVTLFVNLTIYTSPHMNVKN
jgi:hypothetical protein